MKFNLYWSGLCLGILLVLFPTILVLSKPAWFVWDPFQWALFLGVSILLFWLTFELVIPEFNKKLDQSLKQGDDEHGN